MLLFSLILPSHAEETAKPIFLADPTLFQDNGTNYLYGTGNLQGSPNEGFLVYRSNDLKNWQGPCGAKEGWALAKGDCFGTGMFWAPQVFRRGDTFYMAYTANEYIAIATAKSPLGPFAQTEKIKLPTETRQIDPFLFFDDDGKCYLYHVRLQDGNRIFVAEMNATLTDIKKETLRECIAAGVEKWENTSGQGWGVAEGPTVIKRDGVYCLFYSANDFRSPDYAVGYATSKSPLGPWKRSADNPIIHRSLLKHNGTGHGDIFIDNDGQWHYILHIHNSDSKVSPRRTALVTLEVGTKEGLPTFKILPETFTLLKTGER